ncbi:MAG: hypothetical protein WCT77_00170 [Bacteroidota bacterium]
MRTIGMHQYIIRNNPDGVKGLCGKYNMFPRTESEEEKALNKISEQGDIPAGEIIELHPDMDVFLIWQKNKKAGVIEEKSAETETKPVETKTEVVKDALSNVKVSNVLIGVGATLIAIMVIKTIVS